MNNLQYLQYSQSSMDKSVTRAKYIKHQMLEKTTKWKIECKNTPFKSLRLIRKTQDNKTEKKGWKIYLSLTTYQSKLKGKGYFATQIHWFGFSPCCHRKLWQPKISQSTIWNLERIKNYKMESKCEIREEF